jgi:hypothetical protein
MTGTCRLKVLYLAHESLAACVSAPPPILEGHQNVVGWQFVLNYIQTPPIHYYLEYSGQATYKEIQP